MEKNLKLIESGAFVELYNGVIGFVTYQSSRVLRIQKLDDPFLRKESLDIKKFTKEVRGLIYPTNNRLRLNRAIRMGVFNTELKEVRETLDHMNQIMDKYEKKN